MNYMAVSEALSISPSTFGAGLAADDLILTFYFTALYSLAKHIPPDGAANPPQQLEQQGMDGGSGGALEALVDSSSGGGGALAGGGHGGGVERMINVSVARVGAWDRHSQERHSMMGL